MSPKYYFVVACIILVFGFLTLVLLCTHYISYRQGYEAATRDYKRGYEEATKDFYNGNLKTELVYQHVVVWKDEQP